MFKNAPQTDEKTVVDQEEVCFLFQLLKLKTINETKW